MTIAKDGEKIEVWNVNAPDHRVRVDAAKYRAVRVPYLAALPDAAPGLTPAQIQDAIRDQLPQDLFPGGATSGWWCKCVQLDLEARGLVKRSTKPVRLWRA